MMKEIYDFLKNCNVYYLATVEDDQPRVRPFGTVDLFENKLYIQTGKSKSVSRQMKKNPKVEISAMYGGRWIRIAAEVVLDDNIKAQEHMLEAYPSLQAMYQPGDGNTEVFYLKNVKVKICSFTEPDRVMEF